MSDIEFHVRVDNDRTLTASLKVGGAFLSTPIYLDLEQYEQLKRAAYRSNDVVWVGPDKAA